MTFTDFSINVPGTYHTDHFLNCQDHAFIEKQGNCMIGVVSDGIGSLPYSQFTSFLTASSILKYLKTFNDYDNIIEKVENYLIYVRNSCFNFLRREEVKKCNGATLLFFVVTPKYSWIYAKGDGYYGVNKTLEYVHGNQPYIDECTLELKYKGRTDDIDCIWVSTDGLRYSKELQKYLSNGRTKESIFGLVKEEHRNEILTDDLGLALGY